MQAIRYGIFYVLRNRSIPRCTLVPFTRTAVVSATSRSSRKSAKPKGLNAMNASDKPIQGIPPDGVIYTNHQAGFLQKLTWVSVIQVLDTLEGMA